MTAIPSQSTSDAAPTKMSTLDPQCDSFAPPWLLRNGHVQTLTGTYVFGRWPNEDCRLKLTKVLGEVPVDDGDRLVFHDEYPGSWQPGDPVVLLLHGLAGSHESPYMGRIGRQLCRRNARTIRLDWRGSGAGMALARYPYHSGRSADLLATVTELRRRFPQSPLHVVGFSMGGNILLKLLGELGAASKSDDLITRAVAACPPIDLAFTVDHLQNGLARWYDHYFARICVRDVRRRKEMRPDAIVPDGWFTRAPRTMREFDDTFTAPVCGFTDATDYYAQSSAIQFLPLIKVPTLIIAAQNDPVVPFDPFYRASLSPTVQLRAPRSGGHMGFVTSKGFGWLDRQIASWIIDGV